MVTIPGPRENDADDVSLALEVAQSQWARGDKAEALKWLKKAVDAAFEADDDSRGMELSKIAAEVKAAIDKPSKPNMPPPKPGGPMRPSAPPPRRSQPRPAADDPETTGTRRTDSSRRRGSASIRPKSSAEEDEATREYKLEDVEPAGASVADEWPTEAIDDLDELDEVAQGASPATKPRPKSGQHQVKGKPKKPPSRPERTSDAGQAQPKPADKPKRQPAATTVPSTRAIRVAVGRDKGLVYVRPLDAQGLRKGEHDAMLVALTSDGDIRTLFE